uniref:trimeric intracellular cation channel family protein n=1 Tax=Pseudonocardia pini TaxID=2758030 RepID=UPI0015F05EFE
MPGRPRLRPAHLLRPVDLAGTGLFALQGGLTAAAAGLDVFGVLVLSFVTAVGGGIVRDVLLGDTPPAAFRDLAYPVTAFAGGGVVVVLYGLVRDVPREVLIPLDAAALALFAVVGAAKAVDHGMSPLLAALLGTVSGVGGGVMRDVLLGGVPLVLRSDVYA